MTQAISNTANPFAEEHKNARVPTNSEVDQHTIDCVREYAQQSASEISARIEHLDKEWDVERILEANASTLAFLGLILGLTVNSNWFWLTGIVLPFLLQHAIQGWCPPLVVLRRLGVRTRRELDREKYALKVLRGDFNAVSTVADAQTRASQALAAVGVVESA
ncbi:MAG: DUF2892 domain-containing protein [Spirulinaceae cyanobacterium]